LLDKGAADDYVFDLLGSNVLALGKLEDVLLAVDDLERAVGLDLADIARVEPAVGVNGLARLLRLLVVALADRRAANADLTAGVGLVLCSVVHLGHIHELELDARQGATNVAGRVIAGDSDADGRTGLGLTVAFVDLAAKGNAKQVEHLGRDRGCTSHHGLASTTQAITDLGKHELVPDCIVADDALTEKNNVTKRSRIKKVR